MTVQTLLENYDTGEIHPAFIRSWTPCMVGPEEQRMNPIQLARSYGDDMRKLFLLIVGFIVLLPFVVAAHLRGEHGFMVFVVPFALLSVMLIDVIIFPIKSVFKSKRTVKLFCKDLSDVLLLYETRPDSRGMFFLSYDEIRKIADDILYEHALRLVKSCAESKNPLADEPEKCRQQFKETHQLLFRFLLACQDEDPYFKENPLIHEWKAARKKHEEQQSAGRTFRIE